MRVLPLVPPLLLIPMLGGCMMGPNFHGAPPPPASMSKTFVRADQAAMPVPPQLTPRWRTLNDPLLGQLTTRALSSNPAIDVADTRAQPAALPPTPHPHPLTPPPPA